MFLRAGNVVVRFMKCPGILPTNLICFWHQQPLQARAGWRVGLGCEPIGKMPDVFPSNEPSHGIKIPSRHQSYA